MKIDSLRARMTLGLTLFIAFLSLAAGFGLWWQARRDAYERDSLRLQATVAQVRAEIQKGQDWEDISRAIREHNLRDQNGEVEIWRLGANGREMQHLSSAPPRLIPPRPTPPQPHLRDAPPAVPPPPPHTNDNLIPPLDDPEGWLTARLPEGDGVWIVGVPWHRSRHALDRQALALLVLAAFTTTATGVGAWILVGRTLSPIEKLAMQARQQERRQSEGENEMIVLRSPSSDWEIRELVATFNSLLDNVARTARVREQFHTAASHELRTPLQALSGTIHLALSRPRTNEEYQHALQEARTQSERLNALTRDLLVLNQLSSGNGTMGRETVNIAEACDLALSGLERLIASRQVHLDESLLPSEILASPPHLEMLTRNLLENAVKYSPASGTIRVRVSDSEPRLCVWNRRESQSLPSAAEVNAWFEPFFRPDAARASNTGGNGLGLAICKAICDANEWNIEIVPFEDGIEARVRFGNQT